MYQLSTMLLLLYGHGGQEGKKMSLLYDKVLAILPFEKPYFEKYGLSCDFVGHPISKKLFLGNMKKISS